jgi:S1-C subfamily serine protease
MTTTTTSALAALSDDLAAAIARIAPSIVYVDASPRRDASGLVWNEDTIVTVDHVLDRDDDIDVVLEGGVRISATVVGRDASTDLALLRAKTGRPAAPRSSGDGLAVGHIVLAASRDEDGQPGASFGVIGALDGPWRTWQGGEIERFVRPDLTLGPNASGGPLIDVAGNALGINTWGLSRRTGLTVPLATVARVVAQLEHGGHVPRGYLGVALQPVRLPETLRAKLGLSQSGAAIAIDVAAGGPAASAGLTLGDVLLGFGERAIEDADDLQRDLGADSVGTRRTLRILRAGEARTLDVTIGKRPADGD